MLQVVNIGVRAGDRWLLRDFAQTFLPGKLCLVVGPNGAGKSTLIKALSGQIATTTGKVMLNDTDLSLVPPSRLATFRAVLSQHIEIAFPMKVWEVVMMGRYPHFTGAPTPRDHEAVREAMEHFGTTSLADRNYLTLSGGEKQRVHFARVLAQIWYPSAGIQRLLFLDEPLTFLDIHFQLEFLKKLTRLMSAQEIVIVGVVHDLNLAARFADQLVLLHEGRIFSSGTREDVLTVDNVRNTFQVEPSIHKDPITHSIFLTYN